jgi:hydroxymethylpyrimidine/phosphomethylpyrimidine kinase
MIIDEILKAKDWNDVYAKPLAEALKIEALLSALKLIITNSDEILKQIGMSDLTNESTIKNCLRSQGVADGLTAAVERICELAAIKEEPTNE